MRADKNQNRKISTQIFIRVHRYGDVTPRTVIGRVLGVAWMMFGLVLGSVITATVMESMASTIDFEIKEGHKVCPT